MNKVYFWTLPLLVGYSLVVACVSSLHLTVLYDNEAGLKPDNQVLWEERTIGRVRAVEADANGRVAVLLQIKRDFRERVTDQSRFLIQSDSQNYWQKHIEMVNLAAGGIPLPEGAEVEGSTFLSLQLEKGSRNLEVWSKQLQEELDRWEKELNQLPENEWYKQLERQMDYWLSEMGRAGVESRRYFREEVLPRLEEAVRQLKRRLRQLNKEEEADILVIKLEELKSI